MKLSFYVPVILLNLPSIHTIPTLPIAKPSIFKAYFFWTSVIVDYPGWGM
ncbi:MAG: hypothetical protein H8E82_01655 [Candidatus Marinimicrobia bacterium]|nr:hypothetical protein [Candidatus Neomarinimicrobiota bacterium]MBL7047110.1 hypothetical protein [Candidatus Neomarinimicrobiota bacterium]